MPIALIAPAWIPMHNPPLLQLPPMESKKSVQFHNGKVTAIVTTQTTMLLATGMVVTAVLAPIVTLTGMCIVMTAPALTPMLSMESVQFHNGKGTAIVTTQTTMLPATGMVVTAVLAPTVTLTRMPIAMTAPAWTLDRRKLWKLMLKAKLPTYLIVKHK